jgi:hypothetical protein
MWGESPTFRYFESDSEGGDRGQQQHFYLVFKYVRSTYLIQRLILITIDRITVQQIKYLDGLDMDSYRS